MATQSPDISLLFQRLEKLDRQNRRMRIGLLTIAVLVLALIANLGFFGLIAGLQKPNFKEVEAGQITLRDSRLLPAALVLLNETARGGLISASGTTTVYRLRPGSLISCFLTNPEIKN